MNPGTSSVIFTLSLSILILNSQCVDGARYVRVHYLTPIKIPDVTSVSKIEAIQFIITYGISDFGLLMISKYQF